MPYAHTLPHFNINTAHHHPINRDLGATLSHTMQPFGTYYCYGVLTLLLAAIASSNIKSVGVEAFRPIHPRYSPPKTTENITMRLRSSGRSPSRIASHTATQQWDRHLDLARNAHRKRHFHLVRELCSRVISIAEDWSAVEQAHLRLALTEQKAKRVEAARRAFQRGTAACPSSDTLFMAWGLMESKMYEARSKKVAYALLRRAVALNPRRHANVLKWGILFDLKQAGEAVMEAMYSELSHGQAVTSPPSKAWSTPLVAPLNAPEGAVGVSYSTGGIFSVRGEALRVGNGESRGSHSRSSGQGWFTTTDSAASSAATPPSPRQALEFVSRMGGKWSKEREDALAADILDVCQNSGNYLAKDCATSADNSSVQTHHGPVVERSAKFKEVLLQLEKAGKGVVDTGNGNERALGGTWQLVFTTCTTCDRVIRRAGSDVYERLTPPLTEIAPRPSEPPVPFMCEVLVQPSDDVSRRSIPGDATPRAPPAAFFRGWANVSRRDSGRVLLRQQVAPRPAKGVVRGGRASPRPITCKSSPTAVFSALGQVPRATKGLEKLVTQEVTYVGSRLRIGRTKGGDIYVYKRCAWPEEQ